MRKRRPEERSNFGLREKRRPEEWSSFGLSERLKELRPSISGLRQNVRKPKQRHAKLRSMQSGCVRWALILTRSYKLNGNATGLLASRIAYGLMECRRSIIGYPAFHTAYSIISCSCHSPVVFHPIPSPLLPPCRGQAPLPVCYAVLACKTWYYRWGSGERATRHWRPEFHSGRAPGAHEYSGRCPAL